MKNSTAEGECRIYGPINWGAQNNMKILLRPTVEASALTGGHKSGSAWSGRGLLVVYYRSANNIAGDVRSGASHAE